MDNDKKTNTAPSEPGVYRIEDIMRILDVSRATAYKFVHENHFRCIKVRNSLRIVKSSFDEWFNNDERSF